VTTPRPIPRGFTLIETILAAGLGAMVMIGVLAIFAAMDRTDAAAARRFDETAMMTRLHLVMERVWSDLLIQDENAIPTGASGGRNTASSTLVPPEAIRNGQVQQQPRPRILMDSDLSPDLKNMMRNGGLGAGAPQRLEVVVAHPPVPPAYGNTTAPELQVQLTALGAMASRGAFELRPDSATPAQRLDAGEKAAAPDAPGWTLWYRPLPPVEGAVQPDPYTMDPTQDPSAVRLATGLVRCSWQVFKTQYDSNNKPLGREKLPNLEAMKLQDLPAYVQMKVTTASGLTADWMFEVGWGFGPETTQEATESGAVAGGGAGSGDGTSFTTTGGPGGGPGSAADGGGNPGARNAGRNPGGRNPGGQNPGARNGRNGGGPRNPGGGTGRDGP
jgi:hypothetical protein